MFSVIWMKLTYKWIFDVEFQAKNLLYSFMDGLFYSYTLIETILKETVSLVIEETFSSHFVIA